MHRLLLTLALIALATGCGGDDSPGSAPTYDGCGCGCWAEEGCGCGEEEGGGTYTEEQGTATIAGVVKFDGEPPKRRPLDLGAEPFCVQQHESEPLLSESWIVGSGGGVANVFVHVSDGLGGWKFPDAEGNVVLDQEGCQYRPHVLGMRTGQTLVVRNSDPIMHNVHGINVGNKRDVFNYAQAKEGLENRYQPRRPGEIYVKCDVHGWMGAHVHVVKHPFFDVTGEDGAFTLAALPPGTYTVTARHEKGGEQSVARVTVGDGETKEISFTFSK